MSYSVILFDLDGTLTDSAPGILNAFTYALEQFGLPVPPRQELFRVVGPPLGVSFREFHGMSMEESQRAVDTFRVYYFAKGVYENQPFEGVADFLARLKAAGKTLAIATSKPQHLADLVTERFGLAQYFDVICGASLDESHVNKPAIVAEALARCGVTDKSTALMVGDRHHDIAGAKANGIASMGALYGYGSREEFEEAGADYICADFEEMEAVICG